MRVDLFDFDLPAERIALRPARPRDSARLLLVEGREISDRQMLDLPRLLRAGDVLVFNDTKVIPAQLEGKRGEASARRRRHRLRRGRARFGRGEGGGRVRAASFPWRRAGRGDA